MDRAGSSRDQDRQPCKVCLRPIANIQLKSAEHTAKLAAVAIVPSGSPFLAEADKGAALIAGNRINPIILSPSVESQKEAIQGRIGSGAVGHGADYRSRR